HFLEGLLGPSGSSVPSSEATKSREGSRVLQASTQSHASQILTNHQRRQRVEGKQQSIEMKGQRGDDGLRHQSSRVEVSSWLPLKKYMHCGCEVDTPEVLRLLVLWTVRLAFSFLLLIFK